MVHRVFTARGVVHRFRDFVVTPEADDNRATSRTWIPVNHFRGPLLSFRRAGPDLFVPRARHQ